MRCAWYHIRSWCGGVPGKVFGRGVPGKQFGSGVRGRPLEQGVRAIGMRRGSWTRAPGRLVCRHHPQIPRQAVCPRAPSWIGVVVYVAVLTPAQRSRVTPPSIKSKDTMNVDSSMPVPGGKIEWQHFPPAPLLQLQLFALPLVQTIVVFDSRIAAISAYGIL